MAVTIDGTTGVSLVQDGVVTAADLSSTLDLTGKTVTLPAGTGGKVLQVVHAGFNTYNENASSTFADSLLTANITPTSASSKIMITSSANFQHFRGAGEEITTETRLVRVLGGSTTELRLHHMYFYVQNHGPYALTYVGQDPYQYLDSPNTTSEITYKVQIRAIAANAIRYGYPGNGSDAGMDIILTEIAG